MRFTLARIISSARQPRLFAHDGWMSVCLLLCALLSATPAHAHSRLITAQPRHGEILANSPAQVVLDFSAPVEPAFSRIEILQGDKWSILKETSVQGKRMQAALPRLPPGKHHLRWSILSADGHHQTGTLSFTIRP